MINLLSKIFIKNRDKVNDPAVRRAYGTLCSVYGIFLNVLLFAGKYFAGVLSGSVAQCGPDWSDAMAEAFKGQAMPPVATTPIVGGELGGDAPLIGAAENFVKSGYAEVAD